MHVQGFVVVAVSCLLTLALAGLEPAVAPVDHIPVDGQEGKDSNKTYDGTYWVTFSDKVRPMHDLDINVRILNGTQDVDVTVDLMTQDGNTTLTSASQTISPGDVQTIVLKIPQDIPPPERYGGYQLNVVGEGSEVSFKHKAYVNYDPKSFSIFVQTNKGTYKPLQRVHVRAMAILPDSLRPITGEPWDIVVRDPSDIIMWQQLGMVNSIGVVEFSIPLADRVPYGDWTITATVQGREQRKTFTVEDYVLPKFEVKVTLPPFGVGTDTELPIKVTAKYTYGKPLTDGSVVVTLTSSRYHCSNWDGTKCGPPEKSKIWRGQVDKNGEFTSTASRQDLLDLYDSKYDSRNLNWKMYYVKAVVTSGHTKVSEETEESIYFYSAPLRATFLAISPNVYKPGLPWTGYLEVTRADGSKLSPSEATRLMVKAKVEWNIKVEVEKTDEADVKTPPPIQSVESDTSDSSGPGEGNEVRGKPIRQDDTNGKTWKWETRTLELEPVRPDADGFVVVTLEVPSDANYAYIQAHVVGFEKNVQAGYSISPAHSPSGSYLQLHLPPMEKAKVGQTLNVVVKTTEEISELQYQLYSKKMLVGTETVSTDTPTTKLEFNVPLTREMAPSLKMVVFYVRAENYEFVNDAVTLNVDGLFEKPVKMFYSAKTAKPGDSVTLTIEQDVGDLGQDTYAYVLANDLSVQLLNPGTMISEDMISQDLMTYEYGSFHPWMRYMFICGMPSYYGGQNAAMVFNSAGVKVLTDALLYDGYGDTSSHRRIYDDMEDVMAPSIGEESDKVADDGDGGGDQQVAPAQRVRKEFPETWLWNMYTIKAGENKVEIELTAPDTITMWPTSAFTIHPTLGLTAPQYPTNVTTFQPLMVQLQLPNDVTRDEEFCFTASVFNYHTAPLPVLISLAGSSDYSSVYLRRVGDLVEKESTHGSYNYLKGSLDPDEVDSAMFCLTPTGLGDVPLKVSALTSVEGLSDAVERIIKVKPAGIPRSTAFSFLLAMGTSEVIDVSALASFVEGSQYITVNIVGNLLGPILDGIDSLLRRPYGCGEQNMINFAPNVFLLDFFFKMDAMTPERLQKGRDYMLIGYQKARMYEHGETGGYSTFGSNDLTKEEPSLWLTAFITKCFAQSWRLNQYEQVITVDPEVLKRSVGYLVGQQEADGHYKEEGRVFNKNLQGGVDGSSAKDVALTAYTVIALYETKKVFEGVNNSVVEQIDESSAKADMFLSGQLNSLTDPFDICITSYALQVIGSQAKDTAYQLMMDVAVQDEEEFLFWRRGPGSSGNQNQWRQYKEDAINIEATSYALLALLERNEGDNVYLKVVRWLSTQRGPNGFRSTQDTVVGLQALAALPVSMSQNEGLPYTVGVSYLDADSSAQTQEVIITDDNQLMVHRRDVPYKDGVPSNVILSGRAAGDAGKSSVFAEVILGYNEDTTSEDPFFDANHQLKMSENGFELYISVATTGEDTASMTLLEIDIPFGFEPDTTNLISHSVSEVELKGSQLVLYFNTDAIGPKPISVNVRMSSLPGQSLTKVDAKFYRFSLFYQPDIEFSVAYNLVRGEFCEEAKDFSICPYDPKYNVEEEEK